VSLYVPLRASICPTSDFCIVSYWTFYVVLYYNISVKACNMLCDWLDASTFLVIFRVMCGTCQVIAYMLKPVSRTNSDRDIAEIQPDVTPARKA